MTEKRGERPRASAGRGMRRRDFLKVGGAGLAGAALLGVAGCGNGGPRATVKFNFSFGLDTSGTLQELVESFNTKFDGRYEADYRETFIDTNEYRKQLEGELRGRSGRLTLIGEDVTWAAKFAAEDWIMDLSDRFPERRRFILK